MKLKWVGLAAAAVVILCAAPLWPAPVRPGGQGGTTSLAQLVYQAAGPGSVSRPLASKLGDVVSVLDYLPQGQPDGTTNNTAGFVNAAAQCPAVCKLYVPGNANPYIVNELFYSTLGRHVTLAGDNMYASRIRVVATTDGYGISFGSADSSWGGLRNIGIETSVSLTSLVYVNAPNNGFTLENTSLVGAAAYNTTGLSQYALYVNGGTNISLKWLYTTSVLAQNIYLNNQFPDSSFVLEMGDHDIGPGGFMYVSSTSSGPTITLLGGRYEGGAGKDIIQTATANQGKINMYGTMISVGSNNSIIRKRSGTAPVYTIDGKYQNLPVNVFLDDVTPANNYAFAANDVAAPIFSAGSVPPNYLNSGRTRIWAAVADGLIRTRTGTVPANATDGMPLAAGFATMAYGTSVFPDLTTATVQEVVPTDGVAFTLANPLNPGSVLAGQRLTIRVRNTFGVLGAMSFGTNYRVGGAWAQPANGFSRSITFNSDAGNIWREESRTAADVAN